MIRNRLRTIRMVEYQMEKQDFARFLGINFKTYYSIEQGTSRPKLENALLIAQKLNKTVDEIWHLENE